MQKHLKDLKPDKFEDLIAMNALYRPGPIEYIPNFIEVTDLIVGYAEPGDVIITLGAGDVSSLAPIIIDGLIRRFD
jgi:UDP-N-acetylmuramate-alanine ligase